MTKIKLCPFCGFENPCVCTVAECEMQDEDHPDYVFNSRLYIVVCDYNEGGCGASCASKFSEEEAIEAWNRRAKGK